MFSDFNIAYKSFMPGVAFPAVPTPAGATLLALQYQFERSERLSRDERRAMQFKQLENIFRHAWQTLPFWKTRLQNAGYVPTQPLTEDIFARIPLLTRGDIQRVGPSNARTVDAASSLHTPHVPQGHGRIYRGQTSGSTGKPMVFFSSALEQLHWQAFTLRDHFWHRRDFSAKLGAIRYMEKAGAARGWGPSTDQVLTTGPSAALSISTALAEQIAWIQREQPAYLLSYASNLGALAHESIKRRLAFPYIREVRSVSETVRPDLRALVREAWGVKLVDMYTTKETGYLALQCPEHDHYHVQEENVLLEILDDDDQPCKAGVAGRVVVTALHKFAMPMIRHEVGDYAIWREGACSCGRTLMVLQEVLGRTRNMLRLPNGDTRWPLGDLVHQSVTPGILQYQYIQKSLELIEVRLVVAPGYSRDLEPKLTEVIHQRLGHPFQLQFVYLDDIPRSAAGKYEDFRCEMTEA